MSTFSFCEQIRRELIFLSDDLRNKNATIKKDPEMTIKGGALKPDRKTKRTPLWMDDLACLESVSEVQLADDKRRFHLLTALYLGRRSSLIT